MEPIKSSRPFAAFADSRIGGRSENQDSLGAIDTKLGLLLTVCDGMGGGPGGKTASAIAVQEIIRSINDTDGSETAINIIKKAVRRANVAIIQQGTEHEELKGMGSTATVLLINHRSALLAHVGDSRIYQLRKGTKIFRTFDHSMVFDLVKKKVLTEEQARLSVQSNIITRALGCKPDVEVECVELSYEAGDRFLLCTDGIHGAMPEKELLTIIASRKHSLGVVMENLITTVDNIGIQKGGGHDNLSAIIVETKYNSQLKPKMSTRIKNMLMILTAFCVVSMVANVWQFTNRCSSDSSTLSKDSISPNDERSKAEYRILLSKIDSLSKSNDKHAGRLDSIQHTHNEFKKQISKIPLTTQTDTQFVQVLNKYARKIDEMIQKNKEK